MAKKKEVITKVKELGTVQKYLEGKTIVKHVFVKGKLINFVVK